MMKMARRLRVAGVGLVFAAGVASAATPGPRVPQAGAHCLTAKKALGYLVPQPGGLKCLTAGDGCVGTAGKPGRVFGASLGLRCSVAGESCILPAGKKGSAVKTGKTPDALQCVPVVVKAVAAPVAPAAKKR